MRIKNISLNFIIYTLFAVLIIGCEKSLEPLLNKNKNFEIIDQPKYIEIDINPDSIRIEQSPNFSINYSELNKNGEDVHFHRYEPPNHYPLIDREFVISEADSFTVEIRNCKYKNSWSVDLGDILHFPEPFNWINSEIKLSKTEKTVNQDSAVYYLFSFQALKPGKGYLYFVEKDESGRLPDESRGIIVCYLINPLSKMSLNIDEIKWIYDIEQEHYSTVAVKIKGTTNIYRLRAVSGMVPMALDIPIDNSKSFTAEFPVGYSHEPGTYLHDNCELFLYGIVGIPKSVLLVNPQNR